MCPCVSSASPPGLGLWPDGALHPSLSRTPGMDSSSLPPLSSPPPARSCPGRRPRLSLTLDQKEDTPLTAEAAATSAASSKHSYKKDNGGGAVVREQFRAAQSTPRARSPFSLPVAAPYGCSVRSGVPTLPVSL
ncbi:hypothetical protein PCASD_08650 [Puccinia coronata f. sp. avenae]|uniref:Uncharacterized protein n=1 Tax=Puccinia coronata f. sp. avenae TaxID=200324 RepID=A0A2N5V7C6_9BASI|nr:hypothetical protein PCASD_16754 [Puccinia coronata f. sp. avenae]PLW45903.1 hypothetical protein PCASD_08650 [Puccinia coronata f. sp. avenae]